MEEKKQYVAWYASKYHAQTVKINLPRSVLGNLEFNSRDIDA